MGFRPFMEMVLEHWISGTMQTSFRPLTGKLARSA